MLQTKGVKAGATLDEPIRSDQVLAVMQKKLGRISGIISLFKKPVVSFCVIVIPISVVAGLELYSARKKKEEID